MSEGPSEQAVRAWARLVRSAQRLLGAVEADLKREGFPPLAWYDALLELRRAGSAGLRPFELEREMLLAQYNLSRLVDRLEKSGLLAKRPCPDDRRGHVLTISDAGRRLLDRMWPAYAGAIERHFGRQLRAADVDALLAILERLRPAVEAPGRATPGPE